MRWVPTYLAALQCSSPSAVQASPPTAVQVSSLSAPQAAAVTRQNGAEEQNIVITADRHKTYSDTDLAEMETGVPVRLCILFQAHQNTVACVYSAGDNRLHYEHVDSNLHW